MILTNAISGVARSKATRSGYPVLQGAKIKLFALSKVARAGATRANYTSGKPFIVINGVQVGLGAPIGGPGILGDTLKINTAVNATPATLSMTAYGWVPVEGADLVITLGSRNNLRREFGGTIIAVTHRYVGDKPVDANMVYDISGIDYGWGLNRRKVSLAYTNTSVAAIAAGLMTFAPSGYTLHVDSDIGAEIVDAITFEETALPSALAQLVKRVGGDYRCDYTKVVNLFFENSTVTPPTTINAIHPSMNGITWARDLSQVVTRCLGEFGGSNALEQIAPGETLIPVQTAAWYLAAGGTVLINQQRVKYGGLVVGGGGAIVGPGAAPSAALNATVVPGSGVTPGAHDYAVSYVTASGESLPGPRVTVVSGVIAPPTVAPALDTSKPILAGTGPDPGSHDYAITFVATTGGETTPGPRLTVATGLVAPPTTGPTPNAGAIGSGPDPGTHDYAVIFATVNGYTTPGPIGGQIAIANTPIPSPTVGPTTNPATSGGAVDVGDHWYNTTFLTASGETTPGPQTKGTALPVGRIADPTWAGISINARASGTNTVMGGWNYYSYAYRGGGGETLPCDPVEVQPVLVPPPPFNTFYNVAITVQPSPDPACTGIVIYRRFGTSGGTAQIATFGNVVSTFIDNGSVFGPAPPTGGNNTVSSVPKQTIPLTLIPTGPAGTTARRIYRTPVGGGVQKLLTTINNNSTTTYTDTTADSALGAGAPGSNTALVLTAVHLTNIPRATGTDANSVTGRLIYRRSGGAGLAWVGTIADNSGTTFDDTKSNAALGGPPPPSNTAYLQQIALTLPLGSSFVGNRNLYRSKIGSSTLYFCGTFDNVTTTFTDTTPDAGLGLAAPTVNAAAAARVDISAIPIGAASVIGRRVYRTAANGTQLKLLFNITDNTTTSYPDVYADSALTANAPTSDTSLLKQPEGNVLAGSTSLPFASVASFLPTGGWTIVASQLIRYRGISGNNLTGVPATGIGSIGATITFNVTGVAAAMLIGVPASGVGAIKYPIIKGDEVNIFVQEDDLAAQAAVRAQIPGSDGIIEDELQDRRLSYTEGKARCRARLDMLAALDADGKVGIVTVRYNCRDSNSQAGATVTVHIGPPINLTGEYLIQRVSASQFHIPNLPPTYQVEASSVRFSAEALLRAAYAAITS